MRFRSKANATKAFLEFPVSRGQRQVETVNGYVKFLAAQGFASGPLAALQKEWKTFVENEVQGKRQRQIMVTALVQNGLKALAALGGGDAIDQDERENM